MPLSDEKRELEDVVLGAQEPAMPLADVPLVAQSAASMPKAVIAGVVAALVGAGIWAALTIGTNYQIGWMAVGVGFLCGVAVRALGKGDSNTFRVVGAACALLGIVLGNVFTIFYFADKEGYSVGLIQAVTFIFKEAGPIDYLFFAIGIWQGWKVAVVNAD